MKKLAAIAMAAALVAAASAQSFSGTIGTGARMWFDSTEIPTFAQSFEGAVKGNIGDPVTGQYFAELSGSYDPSSGTSGVGLGEFWVKAYLGALELTTGNQVVAWGSTDVFNPVDIVNPLDLSFPPDQEGIPMTMLRGQVTLGDFGLDLVVLPWWQPATMPAGPWAKTMSMPTFTPPPVPTIKPAVTNAPDASWENTQFGGRLSGTFDLSQGLDLGLSYFRGFATTPTLTVDIVSTGVGTVDVTPVMNYFRLNQVGLDFAFALESGLLIKGEAVYKTLDDTSFLDPDPARAGAEAVAGLEYTILGVKTVGEFVLDWAKGAAGADDGWAKTFLLALNDEPTSRISLKAVCAYDLDGSGMGSAQLEYTLADGLTASAKAFAFFGDAGTRYGDWSDNGFAEIGLTYSF